MSEFYAAGPLRELATNLFHGWGYNFYRLENQLRADDQLVRSKAAWLLGTARAAVERAEADWRRRNILPPTRERPFADAATIADAQALERLSKAIGALASLIGSQPVPENDRMTEAYRDEAAALHRLLNCDLELVGGCEALRLGIEGKTGEQLLAARDDLETGLAAIRAALEARARTLF